MARLSMSYDTPSLSHPYGFGNFQLLTPVYLPRSHRA